MIKKMRAAFTICTNNYLAQVKVLAESIKNYAPEYRFYLFLADEFDNGIDYKGLGFEVILAKSLPIDFFSLVKKYNIIELNTCIKASCFKYLFKETKADIIHYFDPDIALFNDIQHLDNHFNTSSILITPHILTPITWQEGSPNENLFLNHGIYNLGYLGLKKSKDTFELLDWWENRTLNWGYYRTRQGLFVDQLWINYVPIFFPDSSKVLTDPEFNMGPWNLHERSLSYTEGKFMVNNKYPLTFYHFSSYKFSQHEISSNYRYTFATNPDMRQIYDLYRDKMLAAGVENFVGKKWAYQRKENFFSKLFKKKY